MTGDIEKASGPRWYAAQVKSRQERLAVQHLDRQGFKACAPTLTRPARTRRGTVTRNEPWFPGYVFVSLDVGRDCWRSVNGTIGVSRLVTSGNCPTALPNGFVEALIEKAERDQAGEGHIAFPVGSTVRIMGGALHDLCGTLASVGSGERVTVLLQLLSGETKVTLNQSSLIAA